jgi:hypothetical protein
VRHDGKRRGLHRQLNATTVTIQKPPQTRWVRRIAGDVTTQLSNRKRGARHDPVRFLSSLPDERANSPVVVHPDDHFTPSAKHGARLWAQAENVSEHEFWVLWRNPLEAPTMPIGILNAKTKLLCRQ